MDLIIEAESSIRGTYYKKKKVFNVDNGKQLLDKEVNIWPVKLKTCILLIFIFRCGERFQGGSSLYLLMHL